MNVGPVKGYVDFDFSKVSRKQYDDVSINNQSQEAVVSNSEASNPSEQVQATKVVSPKPEVEYNFNLKRGNTLELFEPVSDEESDKKVPDAKKDAVLDQYKFFVNTFGFNNSDGTVKRISK